MNNENGFNPAYPYHIKLQNSESEKPFAEYVSHGLTKRELIAAMCLQGLLSNPSLISIEQINLPANKIAKDSVFLANILLSELSSNKESGE